MDGLACIDMLTAYQQEHHVTEKREHPTAMNAFDLINMSKGLNLGSLFDTDQVFLFSCLFVHHSYVVLILLRGRN